MNRLLSIISAAAILAASVLLGGCQDSEKDVLGSSNPAASENGDESVSQAGALSAEQNVLAEEDVFSDRDYEDGFDESSSVFISLEGGSAQASSDSVQIVNSTVTITQEGTYIISGTLDDGMIVVNADDTSKLQLVLNGANINSETSAAIYVLEADKVFITLADGTQNSLSNGGTFTGIDDNNIDGALFSKQDLTLNGSGSLTVKSPSGHGIVCKDDLVITDGSYSIICASHGLDANDSISITGSASIEIDAGKDGIHAENSDDVSLGYIYISGGTFDIDAQGDGISAGSYMQISSGEFSILAGGGSENGTKASSDSWGGFPGGRGFDRGMEQTYAESESGTSMKGLKASGSLIISGGSFIIDSADDSVHSNDSITVLGGSFEIASGDDAFHADNTLTVESGAINISESYEGLEALNLIISGGEISLVASDDGLNAAGGTDSSGTTGKRDGMFGTGMGGRGGPGGGGFSSSNGSIVISGGTLYINASGDGIDANGSVEISGGNITVVGPAYGDTATLDYDTTATITGGTFIGMGASGMAQTFGSSSQGVISVNAGKQAAGVQVIIEDSEGNILLETCSELSFSVIIYSSPNVVSGEEYTVYAGDVSGVITAE